LLLASPEQVERIAGGEYSAESDYMPKGISILIVEPAEPFLETTIVPIAD
jgi:hypothetical protein